MCFSATASLTVGAALLAPGYYAIKQTESPGMLPFASTPLLFSFHQMAEGCLWLSLTNPDFSSWYNPALYGYSIVSTPVWPVWVPFIMWMMEPDQPRKKVLSYFLLVGVMVSLYMLHGLIVYGTSADIDTGHIHYTRDFPYLPFVRPFNLACMTIPTFLSTLRHTKLLAVAMAGSMIVAYIFYTEHVISVWCFFAAILSLLIILVVKANKKKTGDVVLEKSAPLEKVQ